MNRQAAWSDVPQARATAGKAGASLAVLVQPVASSAARMIRVAGPVMGLLMGSKQTNLSVCCYPEKDRQVSRTQGLLHWTSTVVPEVVVAN